MSKLLSQSKQYAILLSTTVGLMGLTSVFGSAPARGLVFNNGGFETGDFTGWSTIGGTSIETSSLNSGPIEGIYQALVSTDTAFVTVATPSDLENFLNLTSGRLDNFNGNIKGGSAIKQSFSANAGEVIQFNWNFLTNEVSNSSFNHFAFTTINGTVNGTLVELANETSTLTPSFTSFVNETGFRTFSYTIPTTGSYTLGIGVANVQDNFGGAGVIVDNVSAVVPWDFSSNQAAILGVSLFIGIRVLRKKTIRN